MMAHLECLFRGASRARALSIAVLVLLWAVAPSSSLGQPAAAPEKPQAEPAPEGGEAPAKEDAPGSEDEGGEGEASEGEAPAEAAAADESGDDAPSRAEPEAGSGAAAVEGDESGPEVASEAGPARPNERAEKAPDQPAGEGEHAGAEAGAAGEAGEEAAAPKAAGAAAGASKAGAEATSAPGPRETPSGEARQAPSGVAASEATGRSPRAEVVVSSDPTRYFVGVGVQLGWHHDRGYERFGPDQRSVAFHAVGGFDVWRVADRFSLAVELQTEQGRSTDDTGLGSGEAQLTTQSYLAALVPRFEVTPWLWPHARVGAGALRSKMRLEQPSADTRQEEDWGWAVDLAAGVSLVLPPERSFARRKRTLRASPLLRLEGGYRFAQQAAFGGGSAGADGLPVQRVSLGSLDRGAGFLRVLVAVRF